MSSYGNVQWADQDAHHRHYLVSWGDTDAASDPDTANFGFASAGEIADKMSSDAFRAEMGEDTDTIMVWRMTSVGPVPVDRECHADHGMGMVKVTFIWHSPLIKGRAGRRTDVAYYRIPGA
jgi:hypothetical protein